MQSHRSEQAGCHREANNKVFQRAKKMGYCFQLLFVYPWPTSHPASAPGIGLLRLYFSFELEKFVTPKIHVHFWQQLVCVAKSFSSPKWLLRFHSRGCFLQGTLSFRGVCLTGTNFVWNMVIDRLWFTEWRSFWKWENVSLSSAPTTTVSLLDWVITVNNYFNSLFTPNRDR